MKLLNISEVKIPKLSKKKIYCYENQIGYEGEYSPFPPFSVHQADVKLIFLVKLFFKKQEVKEMGLNLPGVEFGIKNIKESCQEGRKEPYSNIALNILNNAARYS